MKKGAIRDPHSNFIPLPPINLMFAEFALDEFRIPGDVRYSGSIEKAGVSAKPLKIYNEGRKLIDPLRTR